jgi:succinylarginine dihydrolase
VLADPATVDPRFMVDERKLDAIAEIVARCWPEAIAPADLADPSRAEEIMRARLALLDHLGLHELPR